MRLFVAIELAAPVRSILRKAQDVLRRRCSEVRWVPPEQLHLTLKFLGEVPDARVKGVTDAMAHAAAGTRPFEIRVDKVGCFPPRGPVRIVQAGAEDNSGALVVCVELLEEHMERVRFPREQRPFRPHITLGRLREDRSADRVRSVAEAYPLAAVSQFVTSVTMMSSILSPRGSTYSAIATAELGRSDGCVIE